METKEQYKEFQKEIELKGIEHLIHFTPTINLLSIFEQQKMLSRALLEENNIDDTLLDFIEFLDDIRYDDKHYINLSISSPNLFIPVKQYHLFRSKQYQLKALRRERKYRC